MSEFWYGFILLLMLMAPFMLATAGKRRYAFTKTKGSGLAATATAFTIGDREIPFSQCARMFCESDRITMNGVYCGTTDIFRVYDAHSVKLIGERYFYHEGREDDAEIEETCAEIRERWGEYRLAVGERELAETGRIFFPHKSEDKWFVEVTSAFVRLSRAGDGDTIWYGPAVYVEIYRGEIYVTDTKTKKQLRLAMGEFADADVLYTFLHRFITVTQHFVPYIKTLTTGDSVCREDTTVELTH